MVLFLKVFLTEFIAEMGDKTQLMLIALTSKYKLKDIILGTAAAILVLNGMAVLAGAITGFAAFINVIKVGSVTSSGGNQLETQILIALVLGGMPISGGAKVRFENIIVGSLLYIVLNSGLTMMGFSTQMMQLIQGVVFLVFVAVFADRQSLQVIK